MIRMRFLKLVVAGILFASFSDGFSGAAQALSKSDIAKKLLALKPLPKVHYSWGLRDILDDPNNPLLYELARITHGLSFAGEWVTEQRVVNCVYTCARINKTKPKIPCSIAINFSPWHRRFGKNLPPTDRGPTYYAEIAFFNERMEKIKQWIDKTNKKYKTSVQVGAILLDCERFHEQKENSKWNEAMREALDAIHKKATEVFPAARIEWWGRGVRRVWAFDGWAKTPYFTGKEIKAPLSCSLYTVPELERMREVFRRTSKLADELGIEEVTPWVALASGLRRHTIKMQKWSSDWDYDLIYSWCLGAELNGSWYTQRPKRYAPYNRAKVVVFFPAPFSTKAIHWPKHFIAYVRGATGILDLADLGYIE